MNKKDEHIEPEPETVLPNGKLRMPLRNPNFTEEEKEKRNSIAKRAMNSIIGDLSNAKESKVGHSFDGSCGCVKCLQFKKQFVKPLDQEYLRGMFALFAEKGNAAHPWENKMSRTCKNGHTWETQRMYKNIPKGGFIQWTDGDIFCPECKCTADTVAEIIPDASEGTEEPLYNTLLKRKQALLGETEVTEEQ